MIDLITGFRFVVINENTFKHWWTYKTCSVTSNQRTNHESAHLISLKISNEHDDSLCSLQNLSAALDQHRGSGLKTNSEFSYKNAEHMFGWVKYKLKNVSLWTCCRVSFRLSIFRNVFLGSQTYHGYYNNRGLQWRTYTLDFSKVVWLFASVSWPLLIIDFIVSRLICSWNGNYMTETIYHYPNPKVTIYIFISRYTFVRMWNFASLHICI